MLMVTVCPETIAAAVTCSTTHIDSWTAPVGATAQVVRVGHSVMVLVLVAEYADTVNPVYGVLTTVTTGCMVNPRALVKSTSTR